MLVCECRTLKCRIDAVNRVYILDRLQERGLPPLIRSARLKAYELALQGNDHVKGLEQFIARAAVAESHKPYITGDVFCFEDFVFFLIFDDESGGASGIRAGIVSRENTTEPLIELEGFCRKVSEALRDASSLNQVGEDVESREHIDWQRRAARVPVEFERVATQWGQLSRWERSTAERQGILELLGSPQVRRFLKRVKEAQTSEMIVDALWHGMGQEAANSLTERLVADGLLRREVLIRCNWRGQKLFRLSSSEALALIAESRAKCEFCGTAISDESAEDLITLTGPVSELLSDGSWLIYTLSNILHKCGLTERQIAVGSVSSEEAQVMVCAYGESFLVVLRDTDLSVLDARRLSERLDETEASQLAVIVTGQIDDGAHIYLNEQVQRRSRNNRNREVILIEDMNAAASELQRAFGMAALRQELGKLDVGLALPMWALISASFDLKEHLNMRNIAASAVSSLDMPF